MKVVEVYNITKDNLKIANFSYNNIKTSYLYSFGIIHMMYMR